MNTTRVVLKNSFWNILGYCYLLIISLVSIPLLIQGLTLEGYARYLFVGAIYTLASTVNLGLPTALVRVISDSELHRLEQLARFRSGLMGTLLLTVIVAALSCYALVATHKLPLWGGALDLLSSLLLPLALLVISSALVSYFVAVAEGRRDFAIANTRTFIVGTANTALSAWAALATGSLANVLYIQVVGNLAALLLLILYAASHYSLRIILPQFAPRLLAEELRFGTPVFLGNLAPQLEFNLARLISSTVLSPPLYSALGLAQSLVSKGTGLFNQVTSALFPSAVMLGRMERRDELRRLTLRLTLGFVLASLVALAVMSRWGTPLLTLWLHDQSLVDKVAPLVIAYLAYSVLLALTPAPATVLTALGEPGVPATTAWIHVAFELLALVILLPRLGVLGAPLASLVSVIIPTAILVVKARSRLR